MKGLDIFIITYLYDVVLLIVSVIGLIRFKRLRFPFKILALSAVSTLLLVICENIFIIKYRNNAPIYHIEAFTGYFFYALIYYFIFSSRPVKIGILVSLIIVGPATLINALFFQSFDRIFPTYIDLPTLALLAVLSLLFFKQMLTAPSNLPLSKQGLFWFNTAVLFYSTTKFLNIGLSNAYTHNRTLDYLVFYLWYFIDYIFAILLGFALITDRKVQESHAL